MRRDVMPLTEAAATAAAGGMLCDEDRMSPPWGLLPIVSRLRRCQTLPDEIPRMLLDLRTPLFLEVRALLCPKMKAGPEFTLCEALEEVRHRRLFDHITSCHRYLIDAIQPCLRAYFL